jgi:hypothetical protein
MRSSVARTQAARHASPRRSYRLREQQLRSAATPLQGTDLSSHRGPLSDSRSAAIRQRSPSSTALSRWNACEHDGRAAGRRATAARRAPASRSSDATVCARSASCLVAGRRVVGSTVWPPGNPTTRSRGNARAPDGSRRHPRQSVCPRDYSPERCSASFAPPPSASGSFLRLPADAPDPVGHEFVPTHRGTLGFQRVPEKRLQQVRSEWHGEDWRADAADFLARLPQRADRLRRRARARLNSLRAKRALANARTLRYRSHHIHPERGCGDVEGYFDFGGDVAFPLQVVSSGQADDYARGATASSSRTPTTCSASDGTSSSAAMS